jgi:hypothetical protein
MTNEPGGCECLTCGRIFIGGPMDTACGICKAYMDDCRERTHFLMRHYKINSGARIYTELVAACQNALKNATK